MSVKYFGFYFSSNADGSANDYTIFVELQKNGGTVKIAPRYKNSDPNSLYEIEMDEDDLALFGKMCIDLASTMKNDNKEIHPIASQG